MCFLPFFVLFFCYSDSLQAVYRREEALAFAAREERCPNRITHTNYSLRFHEHVDIYLYVCACISLLFFSSFVDFGVLWRGRGGWNCCLLFLPFRWRCSSRHRCFANLISLPFLLSFFFRQSCLFCCIRFPSLHSV